jgi:hypothetical protein
MNIMLLTLPNEDASLNIMAKDLAEELDKLGHKTLVTAKYMDGATFRPDLLLNFDPKQFVYVQSAAGRWWYCDKLVNVFTMSCENYTEPMMSGYLATAFETTMVCISPAIRRDLINRAKRLFAPAQVRRLDKNLLLIPYGVRDLFTFEKKKNLDAWLAPFTRFTPSKVQFHQPTTTIYMSEALSLSKLNDLTTDGYTVKPIILDRKRFALELRQYAFAIATSLFESFGLYYIEALLSGIVVLFNDFPWAKELLPTYPFIVPVEDLPKLALWVREHYDEAFAEVEKIQPFIRERYLLPCFAQNLLDALPTLPKGTGPAYEITL